MSGAPEPQRRTPAPRRARFPPEIIARAVALHLARGLSLRQTCAELAARGVEVSTESLRAWLRDAPRPAPGAACPATETWTAEASVAMVNGQPVHLWLARSPDGRVLELVVQRSRDRRAALRDLGRLLARAAADAGSREAM